MPPKIQSVLLKRIEDRCPDCPNAAVVTDYRKGDRICRDCGRVLGQVIDEGSEIRSFADDTSKVSLDRTGPAQSALYTSGGELGTRMIGIGAGNTGQLGKDFASEVLERANQRNAMSSADRALQNAYSEISQIASKLSIPENIAFSTKLLYKKVKETGKLKGRGYQFVAAACLFIELRRKQSGRSVKEIIAASSSSDPKLERNVKRCYKLIREALDMHNLQNTTEQTYLARFCDKLGLPHSVTTLCNKVARRSREMGIVESRQAVSTAAATIFLVTQASGRVIGAKQISEVSGHTEQTIRTSYREMYPVRHYLFERGEVDPLALERVHYWGEPNTHGQVEMAMEWARKRGVTPLTVNSLEKFDVKPKIEPSDGPAAAGASAAAAAAAAPIQFKKEPQL